MTRVSRAIEVSEAERLIEDAAIASGRHYRRSWVRLATLAAVGCTAASCLVLALWQQHSSKASLERFRKPFRLYEGDLPMPSRSDQYDGLVDERPVTVVEADGGVTHIFVLGDWGATLPNHLTFSGMGTDDHKQIEVANVMKDRATWAKPQYVLNVGDNFYVAGLEHSCNAPPNDMQAATVAAFSSGWQQLYGDVANKPWLSVLGNHDYGGFRFDKGWPQQIGYSFVNHNWILPARYYMKRIEHGGYSVDYFMIDTNAWDAEHIGAPGENSDHNICSKHNYGGVGTCAANGGMTSTDACKDWFWSSFAVQKAWLEKKMAASDARWKIVNTHFPCGYDTEYFKNLKVKYGLDLMVTGHRHQQELWKPTSKSKYIQSFLETSSWDGTAPMCLVTGGGGGIISQKFAYADYGTDLLEYGFFHLTIHKDWLNIELVGLDGVVHGDHKIHPHGTAEFVEEAQSTITPITSGGICGFYCGDMNHPWGKICPWGTDPWMSCTQCPACHEQAPSTAAPKAKPVFTTSAAPIAKTTVQTLVPTPTPAPLATLEPEFEPLPAAALAPMPMPAPEVARPPWAPTQAPQIELPVAAPASNTCAMWCGDITNPWSMVCPGGTMPIMLCAGCAKCAAGVPSGSGAASTEISDGPCKSWCGQSTQPWDKVCPWGAVPMADCTGCAGCERTSGMPL